MQREIISTLREFQKDGIKFFDKNNGRCILGDDMGIGKTIQALAWCEKHNKRALVVCPASLKYNWQDEIHKHTSSNCIIINSSKAIQKLNYQDELTDTDINYIIISYSSIKRYIDKIKRKVYGKIRDVFVVNNEFLEMQFYGFNTLIIDESHYIKNWKTHRTKGVLAIIKRMKHYIFLSGTIIKNRPIEFWVPLNKVAPDEFNNFWNYAHTFCGAYNNGHGWEFKGATNLKLLHSRIQNIYLRRRKEEVIDELPDKERQIVYHDMYNSDLRQTYRPLIDEICALSDKIHLLQAITRLKIALAELMIPNVVNFIKDTLEKTDKKILIYSAYLKPVTEVFKAFPEQTVLYTGQLSAKNKYMTEKKFNGDSNIRIWASTIRSGGMGLNLTVADKVIFNDIEWTPADCFQVEDRAYRMGQKDNVNIYYHGFRNTYQETLFGIIERKTRVLKGVLDGEFDSEQGSVLNTIIRSIKRERKEIENRGV